MKKIIACILSMILIVGSLPVLSVGAETKSLVETYEFCEELSVLMVLEGHTYCLPKIIDKDADGYKEGKKSTYKYIYSFFTPKNVRNCTELKIFKESDSVVVFGITGLADSLETDIIGDYIFHAREGFYSRLFPDNNCGYFVYTTDNIYSLNGAVEKGIVDVNEMAKLIPYTEYIGENEPPTESIVQPTETETQTDISSITAKLEKNSYKYTGKAIKPAVTVNGLTSSDFTVSYKNNKKVGTATVTITGTGNYTGTITKTFKITKAANPVKVTAKKTVTANAKKNTTIKKAVTVTKAQGKVTYTTNNKKVTFKNGTMTVANGLKKGKTISVKVTVTAKGNSNYKLKKIVKTIKIKVK